MARRRPSTGRKRIEIRRIESKEARQVCFSKRRAGLFKKAGELAILCGAELAVVTFSPGKKAFSFGYPSVEAVLERFAPTGAAAGGGGGAGARAREANRKLAEVNRLYGELLEQLDMENARKERLDAAMAKERSAGNPVAAWLEADVRDMGKEELTAFAAVLDKVQDALSMRADQVLLDALNRDLAMAARARSSKYNLMQLPQQQFHANNGVVFDQFGAGSNITTNNEAMAIQLQMMMAMPPPGLGFVDVGMEMMMQQGFGFLGPY